MTKIFFFDIDGTLAIHRYIPEDNIEALKQLKEKGYLTFICTGRAPFYANSLFKDLVSGYVCCNGRYILYEGKKLYGKAFTKEELNYYHEEFDKLKCGALFASDDASYPYQLLDKEIESMKTHYTEKHITFDASLPFYTFDIFYRGLAHRDEIIEHFKDRIVFNDHGGIGNGDCSTIGFDKGDGIEYILNHFNVSKDDAYAFGDGYNDQAMFRVVGHKIAMGNAVDVLKEKATFITTNVDDHGIMNALKHEGVL